MFFRSVANYSLRKRLIQLTEGAGKKRKEFAEVGTRAYTRGTLSKSKVAKKRIKDF